MVNKCNNKMQSGATYYQLSDFAVDNIGCYNNVA